MIELILPFPPSANRLWTRTRRGIRKTDYYAEWLKIAGNMILAQRPGGISGPYKLTIQAMRPDRRKRDLGNIEKATSDLLQSVGIIEDDSLCEMISMRWVTDGPPFMVRVEPAGVKSNGNG